MAPELDDLVRRVDPDRWLSSRFIADEAKRADVVALYAFDHEQARAPRASSNPLIGEMRLAFWHEALDEIFDGRTVRAHPAAQALAGAVRSRGLPREPLQAMLEARDRELDAAPLSLAEAHALAAGNGGHAARLAAMVLAPASEADQARAAGQGSRWALARLLLDGRVSSTDRDQAREAVRARRETRLGVAAFPAAAHAALATAYLDGRRPSDLEKRLRVTWAVARGRV